MPQQQTQKQRARDLFTRHFLVISIINLAIFFGFQMVNVGLPVYISALGGDAMMVGLVATVFTVAALAMRPFAGAIIDRFGRKGMLIAGVAVMAVSVVAYAIFPFVGVILALRVLQGLGWGVGSTATSTIAADVIPKPRFAEGMGYFALTTAISSVLAPALAIELVQGAGAEVMLFVAFGCMALALLLSIFQSEDTQHLFADEHEVPHATSENTADKHPAAAAELPIMEVSTFDKFVERRAIFPGIVMLLVNVGFGSITTFIALHGIAAGIENVSLYFVVNAIVTLVTRPGIGKLIDKHGYRIPGIASTLCTALTLVVVGFSHDTVTIAIAGALGGLGIGTAMSTFQAMAVASVAPWRRGVATSTYMFGFDLGIAIGSLVAGALVAAFGYSTMYYLIAIFPLAACALFAFAGKKHC